jgi:hypothetical protein
VDALQVLLPGCRYGSSRSLITQVSPRRTVSDLLSVLGSRTRATAVPEQRRASVVCIAETKTTLENLHEAPETVSLTRVGNVIANALAVTMTAAVATKRKMVRRIPPRRGWADSSSPYLLRGHCGTLAHPSVTAVGRAGTPRLLLC